MFTRGLVELIFSAAEIQRWNDHVRPVGFSELDKQAHKMIIAFIIGKFEEKEGAGGVDWIKLIEGGIFEFFHRVKLTDLKPSVFHELMEKKGKELNSWVLEQLSKDIRLLGSDFRSNFEKHLFDKEYAKKEKRILKAAHYLATSWEFKIIYKLNTDMHGIEKTREEIDSQIRDYHDLPGVKNIVFNKDYYGFIDTCGQLGFQQRWAQLRMAPKTSVLGHMLIVAIMVYLCVAGKDISKKRIYNDFFSALFHDIPEVLTRDIINPIKSSIEGLNDIISDFEKRQLEEKLLPLLPKEWRPEFAYLVMNEFKDRILIGDKIELRDIKKEYDNQKYSPVDGTLIEAFDKFSAFVEAFLSLNYGLRSKHLSAVRKNIPKKFGKKEILGFKFKDLFAQFKT